MGKSKKNEEPEDYVNEARDKGASAEQIAAAKANHYTSLGDDDDKPIYNNSTKKNGHCIGKLEGDCVHCGVSMGNFLGTMTDAGPVHNDCIPQYKRLNVERCAHCDVILRDKRNLVKGNKLHPGCTADYKAKKAYVRPRKDGMVAKFACGRSAFGKKNWKERFFVLSTETGLSYWENEQAKTEGKPPKGSVQFGLSKVRMITKPMRCVHPGATNPSNMIIIIFVDEKTKKETKLLMDLKGWELHDEWIAVLEAYIKVIDDPLDTDPLDVTKKYKVKGEKD